MDDNMFRDIYKRIVYRSRISLMDQEELDKRSNVYLEKLKDSNAAISDSNIDVRADISMKTYARDMVIEDIERSHDYTEDNCLLILNPYGYVPLSAMAIFYTDKPYSVKAYVEADKDVRITGSIGPECEHRVPVIGMYAGKKNYICIELYDGKKLHKKIRFSVETDPLPEDMQDMVKIIDNNGSSANSFYYVSGVDTWYPCVFDKNGDVRYFITKPTKNYGVFPLSAGMHVHPDRGVSVPGYGVPHAAMAYLTDAFGRVHDTLFVKNGLHHDVYEINKNKNLLIATSSLNNYCEDSIAEIDRRSGKQINTVNMADIITEKSVMNSADWAHINTVSYCEYDNSVLVSLRNLHSVVKIDWKTKKPVWLLGDPEFWKHTSMEAYVLEPEDEDISWFYQAHSSMLLDDRDNLRKEQIRIGIYDNHWQSRRQTDNFDNDENSYGLVYIVDEKKKTVVLERKFTSFKSTVRSNIVFQKEKDRMYLMSGCLKEKHDSVKAQMYEYRYSDGELVRRYALKNQFYRIYPYEFDYESLIKPLSKRHSMYGELKKPYKTRRPDISDCACLIEKSSDINAEGNKRTLMKTRSEKEAEWERMMQGKTWEELDHSERIARTRFRICGNMLYLYAVDHIVSYLYMISDTDTYVMDFTDTKQELPALFYDYGYNMPIPLEDMEPGRYRIYISCFGKMYSTDYYFIKSNEKESQ